MAAAAVVVEARPELVGKRFLCVSGEAPPELAEIAVWSWRVGVIRAVSHRDTDNPELTIGGRDGLLHLSGWFTDGLEMRTVPEKDGQSQSVRPDGDEWRGPLPCHCVRRSHNVYVEFDDLEWEKREWVKVYEDFQVFLLEHQLVWAKRKEGSQLQGSRAKQIQWPALVSELNPFSIGVRFFFFFFFFFFFPSFCSFLWRSLSSRITKARK
ncbi:putative JmjC domain-containing histone demethylation protein 2C [Bagarius yarrelli]|uniref:Putative JmjC domain-containing histone demethylation protein 2C n=1 Tax=Bagarius yarrelli TaxID=175774 RepID=A0A556TIK2_BAGYA|nr:putative JmjC domain-containing histone demethylation protein 2C [Bagarius yarrelli]